MKHLALFPLILTPILCLAQATQEAQHVTENNIAVGSVTGSYAAILQPAQPLRIVEVVNDADCNLFVSFDGTTDHAYVPAGSSFTYNVGTAGMHISTDIEIKHDGSACTSGYISANGAYRLTN